MFDALGIQTTASVTARPITTPPNLADRAMSLSPPGAFPPWSSCGPTGLRRVRAALRPDDLRVVLLVVGAGHERVAIEELLGPLNAGNLALAAEIARQWSGTAEVLPVTTEDVPRPAPRPAYSVLDVGRFEAAVGRPVESWSAGLEQYLSGMRRAIREDSKGRESR